MAEAKQPSLEDTQRMDFIKKKFRHYYSKVNIEAPARLENREFGVITERGGMWRHLGFPSQKEMQAFLVKQAPLHAYHSSTYYTKPNARTMDEKGWLGADLIFDLDADHIQGTENMNMEDMLAAVKVQFLKLVNEFLLGDFGFSEDEVKIVFSGGRGYHAHVSNESVLNLDSHERREIVDYITLPDPDIEKLIIKEIFSSSTYQGHDNKRYIFKLYPPETAGWKGKTTRGILNFIDRTEGMSRDETLDELISYKGIGMQTAERIYDDLFMGNPGDRGIDKIRSEHTLDAIGDDSVRNSFVKNVLKSMSVGQSGETDEPVTTDVKRLIRLPWSLHGKTSLVVRTMNVTELEDFLPLRDSIWAGFDGHPVNVMGLTDHEIKLKNEVFRVKKGSKSVLPEHAALMMICQKKCYILI
jgi:DNA primase small subunit